MAVLRICDKCGAGVGYAALYRIKLAQVVGDDWRDDVDEQSKLDLCLGCAHSIMREANTPNPKKGD